MINSLFKDSHITQPFCHSQMAYNSGRVASQNERKEYSSAPANNSVGKSVKNPAEISFSGIFNAKAARANLKTQTLELSQVNKLILDEKFNFPELLERAEKFFSQGENGTNNKLLKQKINNLIDEVVDFARGEKSTVSEAAQNFMKSDSNKNNVLKIVEHVKNVVTPKAPKKLFGIFERNISSDDITKSIKNFLKDAVKVLNAVENPKKIFTRPSVKKFLEYAADSQLVFSALFALLLTCTLRPLAIITLPGQKKNKDDKKYAAAHSMASGIIQYIITLVICSPIAMALKKIGKNPKEFLDVEKAKHLGDIASGNINASKDFIAAKKIVNMAPDVVLAIPKAIYTVVLIPPILKYVFKLEKKKNTKSNATDASQSVANSNLEKAKSQSTNMPAGGVK